MLRQILLAMIWQSLLATFPSSILSLTSQINNNLKSWCILRHISTGLQILCIELKSGHLGDLDYCFIISLRVILYLNFASAHVGNGVSNYYIVKRWPDSDFM